MIPGTYPGWMHTDSSSSSLLYCLANAVYFALLCWRPCNSFNLCQPHVPQLDITHPYSGYTGASFGSAFANTISLPALYSTTIQVISVTLVETLFCLSYTLYKWPALSLHVPHGSAFEGLLSLCFCSCHGSEVGTWHIKEQLFLGPDKQHLGFHIALHCTRAACIIAHIMKLQHCACREPKSLEERKECCK